jgi:hypothetical protein
MTNENNDVSRKHFIDNIRSITVVMVIFYHVFYLFNSAGVISNIGVTGIPAFDTLCYFVYPWLMTIMFLVAGISARYALQKRTVKHFLKERAQKLLIPLFGGMFLLGWINGWVIYRYNDIFGGNSVPVFIKYFVFCFIGMGPLWFNLQLFIVSMVLLVIYKIDKKDRLWAFSGKANIFVLIAIVILFWGSSFLLNTPILTTFRNGIYLFVFFAGYCIFSHDKIIETLAKFRFPLLAAGTILGVIEVYCFYGKSFGDDNCLQHPLTNLYSWIMMLAILGCSRKYLDKTNRFLDYVKSRSFFWYLCHYPIMVLMAYTLVTVFKFPFVFNYILLLVSAFGATVLFSEIVRLIPVLRYLLFGMRNKTKYN